MKNKELSLKDKVKLYIIMNHHFMEFEIKRLKKEYELGKISKDYLDGYSKGIEDFKNSLLKDDIKILKGDEE